MFFDRLASLVKGGGSAQAEPEGFRSRGKVQLTFLNIRTQVAAAAARPIPSLKGLGRKRPSQSLTYKHVNDSPLCKGAETVEKVALPLFRESFAALCASVVR